jgi:hypothetical protein
MDVTKLSPETANGSRKVGFRGVDASNTVLHVKILQG